MMLNAVNKRGGMPSVCNTSAPAEFKAVVG